MMTKPSTCIAYCFSLVELMIVLVILGIVLGVVGPQLAETYRGQQLRQSTRQLMLCCERSRQLALYEGRQVRLNADPAWRELSLWQAVPAKPGTVEEAGDRFHSYRLPLSVALVSAEVDGNTIYPGAELSLVFEPGWCPQLVRMCLEDGRGARLRLSVEAGSGLTKVEE